MEKLITLLITLLLTGCGVFGIRTAKEPDYQLLTEDGPIQIRHYPSLVVAVTEVKGDYKSSGNQAFQRLAGYIFGNNRKQQKISMTTPVMQEQQQFETMAMTAPVLQQQAGEVWQMAFVLPSEYSLTMAPIPLNSAVKIQPIPNKKVAAICYSGSLTEQAIAAKSQQLKQWLIANGYKAVSPARSAAYDPPWTLPFLRRNEVHIHI